MKINLIKDIDSFFEVVDKCKGEVNVISNEGDKLSLKSKLCRFVLTTMASNKDELLIDLEVKAENSEDTMLLLNYLMNQ